jgi:hypothetical protein
VPVEWSDEEISARVARDVKGLVAYGERVGYLRARLRLVPTTDGGRRRRIYSGYRSSWHWGERSGDGLAVHHDAPLTIEGSDRLELGAEAMVRLYPIHPEFWVTIDRGRRIEMREGSRVVGEAIVDSALARPGT